MKYVLRKASPEEIEALRAFNIPAIRAIHGYHPKVASKLKDSFWEDAADEGLGTAIKKWQWLIHGKEDKNGKLPESRNAEH